MGARWGLIGLIALVVVGVLLDACGGKTGLLVRGLNHCEPKSERACRGPSGCDGVERCVIDGSGWSECDCNPSASATCFEHDYAGRGSSVSLLFVVDRSTSMTGFWSETTQALREFFADPQSDGLSIALELFPSEHGDDCSVQSYQNQLTGRSGACGVSFQYPSAGAGPPSPS